MPIISIQQLKLVPKHVPPIDLEIHQRCNVKIVNRPAQVAKLLLIIVYPVLMISFCNHLLIHVAQDAAVLNTEMLIVYVNHAVQFVQNASLLLLLVLPVQFLNTFRELFAKIIAILVILQIALQKHVSNVQVIAKSALLLITVFNAI